MNRIKLCKLIDGTIAPYDLCTDSLDLGNKSQVDYEYIGQGIIFSSRPVNTPNITAIPDFHFWYKIATEKTIFKEPTWEPKPNPMSDLNNFIDMVNYRFPHPYSVVRYLNPRWCISPSLDVSITDDVTLGCMRK
jgi:hypothetical protein